MVRLWWNRVTWSLFERIQSPAQFYSGLCWFQIHQDTNQSLHHMRLRSLFTLTLLLILFSGTIGNIDARPQSSLQSERENVTWRTIEAFINTQTTLQLDVSNSCTESIRAVRVCNTPVSHRVFKKNCRGKNVAIDFSNCFHQALTCKFTYDCC